MMTKVASYTHIAEMVIYKSRRKRWMEWAVGHLPMVY